MKVNSIGGDPRKKTKDENPTEETPVEENK
jgi:hypothetical protein